MDLDQYNSDHGKINESPGSPGDDIRKDKQHGDKQDYSIDEINRVRNGFIKDVGQKKRYQESG